MWRQRKNLFQLLSWQGKWWLHPHEVTRGIFSPYCTCSLGLHISTECTNTRVQHSALQPQLAGTLPLPLISWQAVGIIAVPAVNCQAQVIVRGVDRRARGSGGEGEGDVCCAAMPPLRPLLIWPGLVAMVSVFVTMSALLVSSPLWPSQGWNHSSFYSSLGLEAIYHEARDLHQLFRWEKEWGKANTSWFNWRASMLRAAEQISP